MAAINCGQAHICHALCNGLKPRFSGCCPARSCSEEMRRASRRHGHPLQDTSIPLLRPVPGGSIRTPGSTVQSYLRMLRSRRSANQHIGRTRDNGAAMGGRITHSRGRHSADKNRRTAHDDHIRRTDAGALVADARLRHSSHQHCGCPHHDRPSYMRHRWRAGRYHGTDMRVGNARGGRQERSPVGNGQHTHFSRPGTPCHLSAC